MKAEFDKEIDALLRRHPRAAGRGAPAPREDAWATSHLDADELSAFAEHALPEAARLAAVSHLADCNECRGAVVTLSRAAGEPRKRAAVPAPVDPSEAVPAGSWLAALFAPRLLRFVAPALALCLVGAVAFVLLRTRRDGGSVAQHAPMPEAVRPGITSGVDADLSANANTSAGPMEEATANVTTVSPSTAQTPPAGQERRSTPGSNAESEAPDGSDDRDVLLRRPPAEAAAREDAPPLPPVATEAVTVAAAPSPQPAARDAAHEKAGESRRAEADEVARNAEGPQQQERSAQLGNLNVQQQSPDGSRNRSANNTLGGGARSAPAAPRREPDRAGRSITGPRARSESRKEAEPADAGAERTAAGHRFRREDNAWVDVNYRPSMAMTGVRRGTEAFRALVADIPELGRIAEQLPGEVITVVRGRAYRIR